MKDLIESKYGHMFDSDGFFLESSQWTETLAKRIAEADGLGDLTPGQIKLLHNMRGEFEKNGSVTALSHICRLSGQKADCLQHLFPSPLEAWRVAGLPNPGEEAKAYMSKD